MEIFTCKIELLDGPHGGHVEYVEKYAEYIFKVEPDDIIVRECQDKAIAYKFFNRAIGESKPIFRYLLFELPVKWVVPGKEQL